MIILLQFQRFSVSALSASCITIGGSEEEEKTQTAESKFQSHRHWLAVIHWPPWNVVIIICRRLCLSRTFSSWDMWNAMISLRSLVMLATHDHVKTTVTSPSPLVDGKLRLFKRWLRWKGHLEVRFEGDRSFVQWNLSQSKKYCRQTQAAIQSKQ